MKTISMNHPLFVRFRELEEETTEVIKELGKALGTSFLGYSDVREMSAMKDNREFLIDGEVKWFVEDGKLHYVG